MIHCLHNYDTAVHSGENKEPKAMNQCLLRFHKKNIKTTKEISSEKLTNQMSEWERKSDSDLMS